MDFDAYLNDLPLLHSWDGGRSWNTGGFHRTELAAFHRLAGGAAGGKLILETGAGNSTLTFLFTKPAKLISIAPAPELFARIQQYCQRAALDATPLHAMIERSELTLPWVARDEYLAGRRYDLALLDGGHGWPTVFVDFCYCNGLLRKGGILLIDDVQIHAVKELARLLLNQPGYRLLENLGKVLVFEKDTDQMLLPDFGAQPYVVAKTEVYAKSADPFAL